MAMEIATTSENCSVPIRGGGSCKFFSSRVADGEEASSVQAKTEQRQENKLCGIRTKNYDVKANIEL